MEVVNGLVNLVLVFWFSLQREGVRLMLGWALLFLPIAVYDMVTFVRDTTEWEENDEENEEAEEAESREAA